MKVRIFHKDLGAWLGVYRGRWVFEKRDAATFSQRDATAIVASYSERIRMALEIQPCDT